ncbi:hypothetical protein [Flavobacterium sp. 3HN19-14]|uniref:hypothetical protein n=1 Tax=Flavobacterium sp. 3HN19-14 TaxID=3448133 RepID=UPI003EE398B9
MEIHIPYEQRKNRKCDFIVKYRFLSKEEGNYRLGNPMQGYRSDFLYAGDEKEKGLWMIWPEFLDNEDNVITDKTVRVSTSGKAQMWILNDEFFQMHRDRIKIGLKAYFVEGRFKTAECEVIEITGLL